MHLAPDPPSILPFQRPVKIKELQQKVTEAFDQQMDMFYPDKEVRERRPGMDHLCSERLFIQKDRDEPHPFPDADANIRNIQRINLNSVQLDSIQFNSTLLS